MRQTKSSSEPALVIFGTADMVADETGEEGLDSAGMDEGGLDDVLDVPPIDDLGSG
ncbi:MAG: hypothetical protein IIA45_13610, partial [Bacteroidetes bacterium]|nr:hypothetical protein [Bacteroidota bacterium]